MFEKVLVCLDGSGTAERILAHITEDALRLGSVVVLLRVVNLPGVNVPLTTPGAPGAPVMTAGAIQKSRSEEEEATRYLDGMAVSLRARGLDPETVVLPGAAGTAIVSYSRENAVTLIVVASHGHGGLRRLTIGSTADYVLRNATVPVLMVTAASP